MFYEKQKKIEELQEKHETFNEQKEIIVGVEVNIKRWETYIERFFDDVRPQEPTKSEVIHVIKLFCFNFLW